MRAGLVDFEAWVPGGWDGLHHDLRTGRSRLVDGVGAAPEPQRPDAIPGGEWRRMSRLGRGAAQCAAALYTRHPEVDWGAIPVVWGTALGEVDASSTFLDRLHAEGPERVSPLVFQGSVYNAAVGRLSLALGLRGPSETVAAGQATAGMALYRGAEWLARAETVLVLVGDELAPAWRKACVVAGVPPGEGAVALLLAPGDDFLLSDALLPGGPTLGRQHRLPYEPAPPPPVDLPVDPLLGVSAALPLAALLALAPATAHFTDAGGQNVNVHLARPLHDSL